MSTITNKLFLQPSSIHFNDYNNFYIIPQLNVTKIYKPHTITDDKPKSSNKLQNVIFVTAEVWNVSNTAKRTPLQKVINNVQTSKKVTQVGGVKLKVTKLLVISNY